MKFLQLSKKDFIKGLIMAAITSVVGGLAMSIACIDLIGNAVPDCSPHIPTLAELKVIGIGALSAFTIYIVKNFFTNSEDKFMKTEPK